MIIGSLGDIVFEVSDSVVKTISQATLKSSVSIQKHSRHMDSALQEFIGIEPDTFTLTIKLSVFLGVDPLETLDQITEYEKNGIAVPLVIGEKTYGKYRWLIKSHDTKLESYDGRGNVISATVNVTLTEYIKR